MLLTKYIKFDTIRVQNNNNIMSNNNLPAGFDEDERELLDDPTDYYSLAKDMQVMEEVDTEPFEKKTTLASHPLWNTPSQLRK
jgi:hypothetical protein